MLPASPVDRQPCSARRTRRGTAGRVLLAGIAVASLLAACSLDWTVRSEPVDASVAETGADVADAPLPVDAADADAPVDAPIGPDSSVCDALAADLAGKKAKARECQISQPGQCTSKVDDECGCGVIIRLAASTETSDYTTAVSAFVAKCGKPPAASCTCPQLGSTAGWACLQNGPVVQCRPP